MDGEEPGEAFPGPGSQEWTQSPGRLLASVTEERILRFTEPKGDMSENPGLAEVIMEAGWSSVSHLIPILGCLMMVLIIAGRGWAVRVSSCELAWEYRAEWEECLASHSALISHFLHPQSLYSCFHHS